MASTDRFFLRQVATLFNVGAIRELTDGQLLQQFATGGGEVAEAAFAALVERHGAMVLRVCRAQLNDPHDAQDAFQATFLVLINKARGLWVRDSLGPWLHQVAFRTAVCARAAAARRRRLQQSATDTAAHVRGYEDPERWEHEQVLHEEINRLPEHFRVPIVLCDLQGHTCEQAARHMGRSVGTIKSWRARGRERLRGRLIRLGLAPSAVLVGTLAADRVRGADAMAEETLRVMMRTLSGRITTGEMPASVLKLVNGVITAMVLGKLRTIGTALVALAITTVGFVAVARVVGDDSKPPIAQEAPRPAAAEQPRATPTPAKEPQEIWRLTLREAINIGLDNSDAVRVVSLEGNGGPLTIMRLNGDGAPARFKAEAMAHVRSIEEQYWTLAQQHAQLWASEKAVELAEEVLKREESLQTIGRGTADAVAEAKQRLEQFRLDLVTKTSDVITTERQLRNILGLPKSDGRRIVLVTAPTEARLEPDWKECLANMNENQPDLVQARARVKEAEADVPRDGFGRLKQQNDSLARIVDETTHSLARFFLEVDANHKQFKMASRLRAAAAQRLDAQRAFYEEGRITIDRYLDAVSQYASGVAQESQFKTTYNISIVALEEAKGTLLKYDHISVVDDPQPTSSPASREDVLLKPASIAPPAPGSVQAPPIAPPPANATERQTNAVTSKAVDRATTFSFEVTGRLGSTPIELRGSFTITPAPAHDATGHTESATQEKTR